MRRVGILGETKRITVAAAVLIMINKSIRECIWLLTLHDDIILAIVMMHVEHGALFIDSLKIVFFLGDLILW